MFSSTDKHRRRSGSRLDQHVPSRTRGPQDASFVRRSSLAGVALLTPLSSSELFLALSFVCMPLPRIFLLPSFTSFRTISGA